MSDAWAINASPLILFARIARLDLFERRAPTIIVPNAVFEEVLWVVLDDLAARRCAASHGLAVIGSLGVVLRSKQRGLLDEARPWVTKLVEAGMFVDGKLLDLALEGVGE